MFLLPILHVNPQIKSPPRPPDEAQPEKNPAAERKKYQARVQRDGKIAFAGKAFHSPSLAGAEAAPRPANGWWFWKYERSPDDWVRLPKFRQR